MSEVPEIDPLEGARRVDAGAMLLDVRNADEWAVGHASDAIWIPMDEIEPRRGEISGGREVVVICRSGARSAKVTEVLRSWGHDAVNLAGGSLAWLEAGLPFDGDVS
jgi:rhodanese-related sulfurtransferase